MGASRKLQGEIDRVLKKVQEGVDVFDSIWNKVYDTENANQKEKFEADLKKEIKKLQRYRDQIKTWIQSSEIKDKKVSASYEQALMDARKLIEREMERFKVCEKETKTKAFSKEGLGQQPKTDPKEKAKAETREWLNTAVGDLEGQIDCYEAEVEGLSVKKGKTRPPRLTHLEESITRHKAHIMKLELILRLLDNDELSPEQVNDVRDFVEDYVERNQEDFDEFSDVDELYNSLPLDKVEALEDLVAIGPPSLVKGVGSSTAGSGILSMKSSVTASPTQLSQGSTVRDHTEETASQDSNSDTLPRTPPSSKSGILSSSNPSAPSGISSGLATGVNTTTSSAGVLAHGLGGVTLTSSVLPSPGPARSILESGASAPLSPITQANSTKEDDSPNLPGRRPSPALSDVGLARGTGRGIPSSQPSASVPLSLSSGGGALGTVPAISELAKRSNAGTDERIGSGVQQLVSPLTNRVLLQQPIPKSNDSSGSTDTSSVVEGATLSGRVFNPSVVSGVQWRPHSASSLQNQTEAGQVRRPEFAPDQREKYLYRLQQVQQQGHGTLLGGPHLPGGNHKQFITQQQSPLLQQLNSQSSSVSGQAGLGIGVQSQGFSTVTSGLQLQLSTVQQGSAQNAMVSSGILKDSDVSGKLEDQQSQQKPSDDSNVDPTTSLAFTRNLNNEEELKSSYTLDTPVSGPSSLAESQMPRDTDLSPGQPLPSSQSSVGLGVIGRRSISDLGAIGDNLSGSSAALGAVHDHLYNLQMLEAACYNKLPQPSDSERTNKYVPKHPAATPSSYPQTQAPITENPAFWGRVDSDTLFFAFYNQQNTYQQYLAARELKRQSWRYHKKYNTWFQRHEEPKITTHDFEQGTYVYFDFHITNDEFPQGWCQRIKTEFTFEYTYLEDELVA
ncbi:hypothetical protein AMTRI_Chr03g55810 [Amborella trichopoda]